MQRDDGEIYDLSSDGKIFNQSSSAVENNDVDVIGDDKKPWWKFW